MLKFTQKTGYQFDRGDVKGFAFNTKKQFSRLSAAVFSVKGNHLKMKSVNSDRLYFILNGSGNFIIKNKPVYVNKNDVIIIPKNTPYRYEGQMKCFLVHSPAFDRAKEIRYNESYVNN